MRSAEINDESIRRRELRKRGHGHEFLPTSGTEVLENVDFLCFICGLDLIRSQAGLSIEIDDSPTALFRLTENLVARNEPNPAQNSLKAHELVGPFQRMSQCING
jgi:hypothetical protein